MRKYLRMTGVALCGMALIFSSCVSTPDYVPPDYDAALDSYLAGIDKTKQAADLALIDDSLHSKWHYTDALIDPKGGVRYRILEMGTGEKPLLTSLVLFSYSGRLFSKGLNSKPFDENLSPSSQNYAYVYQYIPAMLTTLPLLPEGSRVQMFIPSELAYGSTGSSNPNTGEYVVPRDAILIFDLTLEDVITQTQ